MIFGSTGKLLARLTMALTVLPLLAHADAAALTEAATDAGALAGSSVADGKVALYQGIPFAAPPVGSLRWRAPQPVEPWKGVRKADRFGPRCMQSDRLGDIDPLNKRMGEDCLYLNVWTPARSRGERLPVMVWFHGGSHTAGSGSEPWYSGENLARKGVIVVTANYRVDVFGFLAHPGLRKGTGTCKSSGNYGLLDHVAALQWVQRNIASFGGDPKAVTIFGESAGSVSVSALLASPRTQGLFQRAIGQSGSITVPARSRFAPSLLTAAESDGAKFAASLGAGSADALRSIPAEKLLQASLESSAPFGRFGVIVGDCVLPQDPATVFAQGKQHDVPLLAGWTADEGTLFNLGRRFAKEPPDFGKELRDRFGQGADAMLRLYPAKTAEEAQTSSDALLGDELVAYPTWQWIEAQAKSGTAPVYRYLFDLRPPAPEISRTPLAAPGVFHSADILYAFDNLQVRDWPWRAEDRELARITSDYWVNFARTGNPNGSSLPSWPAYQPGGKGLVMYLAKDTHAAPERHRDRYELLRELYESAPTTGAK